MSEYRGPYALLSGYDGANTSPRRGYLYWPNTNTRLEATPLSRWEIRRRVHWLFGNVGIAKRLVKGMARLIGFQLPQPDTADEEFNARVFEHFVGMMSSPLLFDASGKFDFMTGQIQMEETAIKDGYVLPVLTEGPTGMAQVAVYEAYQLKNPLSGGGNNWSDGVQVDKWDRHTAYGLVSSWDAQDVFVVQAADALYYGRFESWGETHPMSVLAGAVNNLIDIVETRADIKQAIKKSAGSGMVIEKDSLTAIPYGPAPTHPTMVTTQTMPDGTERQVTWEVVTSGSATTRLNPGEKAKIIHDDRPGPNNREFEKDLIADCANYADLPVEALFFMAGITGPAVRYWMADIRRWVLIRHLHRARWNQRFYATFLAKEIREGRLKAPVGDDKFWRATWIGLADPTIDEGRQGSLSITQLDAGLTTWSDEWGKQGAWWKNKIRQRVREVAFAKQECLKVTREMAADEIEVRYEEVFRPRAGSALPAGEGGDGAGDAGKKGKAGAGGGEDEDLPDPGPEE